MSDRFDDLVGDIEDPAERDRLRRVHELLLVRRSAAGAARRARARSRRPRRRSSHSRGGVATRSP